MSVGAVALVLAGVIAAYWPRPVMVDLGEVRQASMSLTISEDGITRARNAYVISTPVAGELQRVELEPGARVEKDETIVAHMRPAPPPALDIRTRQQALAAVKAAEAALKVARADHEAAVADRELAEQELERTRKLFERGIASEAALERARQAAKVATSRVETSRAAIAMRSADLANARARLIGFEDQGLANAIGRVAEEDIPIVAPTSGVVLRVIQRDRASLPAGSPIMEVGDVERDLEVVAHLLSTDAVQVETGARVIIENWGRPTRLEGKVTRIDPFATTRVSALGVEEQRVDTVIALVSPPSAHKGLGHGYRVEVHIVIWETDDALTVPSASLFRQGADWAVFVVEGDHARLRKVEIGRNNGTVAEVLSALAEGTKVVLYPTSAVGDGVLVARRNVE